MTRVPRLTTARRILSYTADTVAIFFGVFFAIQNLAVAGYDDPGFRWRSVGAGICLIAVYILFWRSHRAAFRSAPRPTGEIVLGAVLATVAVGLTPIGGEFVAIIWLMGTVLHVRLRTAIALAVVVIPTPIVYLPFVFDEARIWPWLLLTLLSMTGWTVVLCGLMLALRWFWQIAQEFHEGQEARARLAVSEERLRFARDLHDLLGHSLSVISLKSELSAKLSRKDPDQAADEMHEVRRLAKESLTEVRAAVRGYRALDLDEELSSVRAVLEAANVRCSIHGDTDVIPQESRTLLAWTVREGVTNILKHSNASHCAITIGQGSLEIRNDGIVPDTVGDGSGLRGLSERMADAGGCLTATTTESGEFLLRAAVPA